MGCHRRRHGGRAGRGRPAQGGAVMSPDPRIVIIGAGPTGLGAGYRLQELGHDDWVILEANDYVGGLATSFTDDKGFTYDIGGHGVVRHYQDYQAPVAKHIGGDLTAVGRAGAVRL